MGWRNADVLVTGADGFIGSHLVEELIRRGSQVSAVVRRTSRSQVTHHFHNLSRSTIRQLRAIVQVDLAGPSAIQTIGTTGAQVWFHLAADAYVPASLDQPGSVTHGNVMSTLNVLEAARIARPSRIVVTSSSEVYGSYDRAISESDLLWPATPYAASKVACDRLAWAYYNAFDLPVAIVRPFNCYGPRHVYDVIPRFIVAALRGEPLMVNGDGSQTRDFTFVDDTVQAFLRVAELSAEGEVFNVGSGIDRSVLALARQIIASCDSRSQLIFQPPRLGEVQKLLADSSKLREAVSWSPTFQFDTGLQRTIEWVRTNLNQL